MGFSFKVAPGVRIRANSRGLRTSVGPRAARVHFGAGRPGISTGAGPVTLYHSMGTGQGQRRSSGPSRTSLTAYERQVRQAEKVEQATELVAAFQHILSLHQQDFPPACPPVAPEPHQIDEDAIRQRHEREALQGIGMFHRAARSAAKQRAVAAADQEIQQETAKRDEDRADLQRQLDEQWQKLLANDPDMVRETLTDAFDDNEAHAVVVGVHSDEAAIVVLVPGPDLIPERMPRLTDAGNLSIPKITKRERNDYYTLLVCGHVLATVREALAVAPGIGWVRIVAVRLTPPNAYGAQNIECLLAALFKREAFHGIRWDSANAAEIVNDASAEQSLRQGRAGEILPLDLSQEPALAGLVQAFEVDQREEVDHQASSEDMDPSHHVEESLSQPSPGWCPRPGWGTIRDYVAVANNHGGIDVHCKFVPDDGSAPIELDLPDIDVSEMGEYARGVMLNSGQLTLKVSAASMIEVERDVFTEINAMDPMKRALMCEHMHEQGNDLYEDCGWAWTPDFRLVKAAPGLIY